MPSASDRSNLIGSDHERSRQTLHGRTAERDPTGDSTAVPWRSTTTRVALGGTTATLLGVLPIAAAVGRSEGATTVGLVLAEAIALYVGYGVLARLADPVLQETLGRD